MRGIKGLIVEKLKDLVYLAIPQGCKLIGLIPRKGNLWVFGAWKGNLYADNAKYMFEYVNAEHPEICAVWIAKSRDVVKEVRGLGYEAEYRYSLRGIRACIRASVAMLTEDTHDISKVLISGAKVIQLWHGMGIKDVSAFIPDNISNARKYYLHFTHPYEKQYWMTACEDAVAKYSRAFNVPADHMFITGQPKDDNFVEPCDNDFIARIRSAHPGCSLFVYLPTHRNFGAHQSDGVLSYETLCRVNQMLAEKNLVMIFKPHAHEFCNYQNLDTELSNLIFATDPAVFGDVYEFLPACDGLVTDYSGIMLGYLTCEKPIVYFPYDLDSYIAGDAGFCYSYDEVTAGPICRTWDETVNAMAEIIADDRYAGARRALRMRFSPYADGKNRERVFRQVMAIVNHSQEVSGRV